MEALLDVAPSRRTRGRLSPPLVVGLLASLLAHWLAARSLPRAPRPVPAPRFEEVALEAPRSLPAGEGPGREGGPARSSAELAPGGSTARANVDAERAGGGGDATGAYEVVLLVSERTPVTLVDAPLNAADRSQIQRIDTGSGRASWENRRATPSPSDDPFLASGSGEHRERREVAATDARAGARTAPTASLAGDPVEGTGIGTGRGARAGEHTERVASRSGAGTATSIAGGAAGSEGAARSSPGRGIVDGEGVRASSAASVATGRPSLDRGPAATLAEREGRVSDDVDAEHLAASLFESRVDASRRAGLREGAGRGGVPGGAGEGTGAGSGVGGTARPFGPGAGGYDALDTSDARYRDWLLSQRRRIEARLEFPRARQLARDQGTSVVRLTVRRDGSVSTPPRVIRSSGLDDLDAAALRAVRESLPFAPVPDDLAPGRATLTVTLPIEFSNPMVR